MGMATDPACQDKSGGIWVQPKSSGPCMSVTALPTSPFTNTSHFVAMAKDKVVKVDTNGDNDWCQVMINGNGDLLLKAEGGSYCTGANVGTVTVTCEAGMWRYVATNHWFCDAFS